MQPGPFTINERVRWSDVDFAGIIFYGAYVRFFEIAETELFRSVGLPYSVFFDQFNLYLPRAHFSCDFRFPARLDDHLQVAAYVTRFGRTSLTLQFDVVEPTQRRLTASAKEVLVATDRVSVRPIPLPGALRDALAPHHLDEAAARAQLSFTEADA